MEDWDSLLNPYEESIQQGLAEGRESGLNAGFDDGHHLGKVKALEIGFELGYMRIVAVSALTQLSEDDDGQDKGEFQQLEGSTVATVMNSHDRKVAKLNEFIALIQDFPSSDVLFSAMHQLNPAGKIHGHHQDSEHQSVEASIDDEEEEDLGASSKIDVVQKMQRIRAKFKTILVQMKIPHLTLKKVMNGGAIAGPQSLTKNNGKHGSKAVSGADRTANDNEW